MTRQCYLTYLKGHQFVVEAEVLEVAGSRIVKNMEVQIPLSIDELDPTAEYYIPMPDEILDNCYTAPHSAAPTLRDHFRSEVINRNLSIGGHLDNTTETPHTTAE